MAEAAPIEDAFRQVFHSRQNGSAGGGEAGDDLKQGIDESGDLPGDDKGQAAGQAEVVSKAQSVARELKAQSREIESLQAQIANSKMKELFENTTQVKGVRYLSAVLKNTAPDSLRTLGDQVKADAPDVVGVFAASCDGKSSVLAVCGEQAVKAGAHAGKLVKEITAQLGGKGGGRPDSAMGGAADLSKAEEVLSGVPAMLEGMLK